MSGRSSRLRRPSALLRSVRGAHAHRTGQAREAVAVGFVAVLPHLLCSLCSGPHQAIADRAVGPLKGLCDGRRAMPGVVEGAAAEAPASATGPGRGGVSSRGMPRKSGGPGAWSCLPGTSRPGGASRTQPVRDLRLVDHGHIVGDGGYITRPQPSGPKAHQQPSTSPRGFTPNPPQSKHGSCELRRFPAVPGSPHSRPSLGQDLAQLSQA